MIPQPDELCEAYRGVAELPKPIGKRRRDSVVPRRQKVVGRQSLEPKVGKRRNVVACDAMIAKLHEVVRSQIGVS